MLNSAGQRDSITDIPGTSIHIYSILLSIAILAVIISSWYKMHKRNIPTITLELGVFIIVPFGLLGARFWYVANNIKNVTSIVDVFAVWEGGMSIYGGVLLGVLVGLLYFYKASKKYKISLWVYLDCILPNILLGQAIGRWGNFFNQEILGANMGRPFNWLPDFINLHLHYQGEGEGVFRQPLFLYEFIASLLGWIIITFIVPKIGFWFSKKPWKLFPSEFKPLWNSEPINWELEWYKPWKIVKKIYLYNKWKNKAWEQAYFDFEPDKITIDKTNNTKKLNLINITSNMSIKEKAIARQKNAKKTLKAKIQQDAAALNKYYNPHEYLVTYAGVAGSSYFLVYGIIRLIIEPFRDTRDILKIGIIPTSVVFSLLWIISGITLIVFAQVLTRKKLRKKGWFYERQY